MTRVVRLARVVQAGSLCALLFLLPFAPAAVEMLFGVLLVGWLIEWFDSQSRAQSVWRHRMLRGVLITGAIYLAICALSIVVSDYPVKSLLGFVKKWVQYLLLFVIAADVMWRRPVIKKLLALFACSSLLVVCEALVQELFGKGFIRGYRFSIYSRITGPYQNPSDLATYLMVIIPILLSYAVWCRRWFRWLIWALLLVLSVYLAKTQTVGAFLGLGAGLLVTILTHRSIRRAGTVLLVLASLIGVGFLHHSGRLTQVLTADDIGRADRVMMWKAALGMIKDRPILGHGLNTFMANYLKYWVGGERMPRYAHNCYLQVAAETGLTGLAAFLAFLGMLFWHLIRRAIRSEAQLAILLPGFIGGLLAFVVQAGVDTNFYSLRQAVLFWVLAGVAVGLSEQPIDSRNT